MGRPSDAREQLITAAKEMIYANGYEAVSVDELCAAAGVGKSSFYHFFSSKQALLLAVLESRWQQFEELILKQSFLEEFPPQERILRFFDTMCQSQRMQKQTNGHVRGCPFGNLTLELSTRDEIVRARLAGFFQQWLRYFEGALRDAQEQGLVPETLDTAVTAQALLAYFEGALLLAKGNNDPMLIQSLRQGVLTIMGYRELQPTR